MKKLMLVGTAMTLLGGCFQQPDDNSIRDVLPEADSIQVKVPGAEVGATSSGVKSQGLVGQTAEFYALTRKVSRDLNGGAAVILGLVKAITEYPVTSVEGGTWIWGPWREALNPSEYRLTVSQDAAGDYHWALEGRAKGSAVSFQPVVSGVATPGRPHRGVGSFHMDFDVAERLDPVGNDGVGQLDVSYDLESNPRRVQMGFARPIGTQALTFNYGYAEADDGSGDFQFTVHGDLDDPGSSWEDAEVRSRWLASGAGRSDLKASGGDLGAATVTGVECWSSSFGRVFWSDNMSWQPTEGDPAACAYQDVKLPE